MMGVNWMIHGFTSVTKIQLATTLLTRTAGLLKTLDLRTGRLEEVKITLGMKVPADGSCDDVRRSARETRDDSRVDEDILSPEWWNSLSVCRGLRAGGEVGHTTRPCGAAGVGVFQRRFCRWNIRCQTHV